MKRALKMAESGEDWELSKENIRPIQQGRKQKILKVALAPHPEEIIAQQRQSFENELRTYSGTDPLFVWCKYIKWVEQNYPKGGREGHIKQLVERCLSILKDDKKYYDDERFIEIMIKYASLSGKPLEVYDYMYSNKIGCKSAKLFINWSWELEQLGSWKKADEVLTEGLQHKAEPFEKIKSYRADFEIRLATKIKDNLEKKNSEDENVRSAFAMLKPQKKTLAPVMRTGDAVIERTRSSLVLGRQQPQPRSLTSTNKIPFKIYDAENINPSLPVQRPSHSCNGLNPENYKENEQRPSKWNKIKVKPRGQSLKSLGEVNPDFQFHCDDESDEKICTPRSVPKTSNILSTRRRTPSPPMALFEPPDPKKKPMYPKNKVYGGAEEFSLEEIRAAEWLERKKKAEQERLLAEQQRKIRELVENDERRKKQVEHLAKQLQQLQSQIAVSGVKPPDTLGMSEINVVNGSLTQSENSAFSQHSQTNSNVGLLKNNYSLTKKNADTTEHYANNLVQGIYNESLPGATNDTEVLDLNREFGKMCSTFLPNRAPHELFESDKTKNSNDKLPFTLYNDQFSSLDNISSKGSENVIPPEEISQTHFAPKVVEAPFSFFHDPTETQNLALNAAKQPEEVPDIPNESNNKLPFTFYVDPTETISSKQKASSGETLNTQESLLDINKADKSNKVHSTSKESNNEMPFEFYHDPTTTVTVEKLSEPLSSKGEPFDEDLENVPPDGYVQDTTKRELAGILEPSKNIHFIPLEEQELEKDDNSDFEEDYICHKEKQFCDDDTLIPPSNTEQFSTAKFLASTPYVARMSKDSNLEVSNVVLTSKQDSEDDSVRKNMLAKHEIKSSKESGLNNAELKATCHSRLPEVLSVIMETSRENYSKSSSSSSCASLTKSNNLDQVSTHQISLYKLQSKRESSCEPHTVSSLSEAQNHVPRETLHCTDVMRKVNQEVEREKLFSVDWDPFDQKLTQKFLESVDFSSYNIVNVKKSIKVVKTGEHMLVGKDKYVIDNLIAEGAYAKVYKIMPSYMLAIYSSKPLAAKVCRKANEWELYICSEIQRRLTEKRIFPDIKNSVMNIISSVRYSDGIALITDYGDSGTLLDVINYYKKQNSAIPEVIVMFFTLQILRIVSKLHELNIIHGDIKPDNFLLKRDDIDENIFENLTQSTGCLQLIDFGRAIDLDFYEKGICFTTTFSDAHFKCNEMKDKKPWVFQLDWYGVASCIYTMLFMDYMKVSKNNNVWSIDKKLKRYWYTALWQPLFEKLLNIPECYEEPDVTYFTSMIESRLQQNATGFISQLTRFSMSYSDNK